ncbi:hypothetical protein BSL78_17169 [Apostichopus japonicus]|uniref:Uncharacterized protein n=1 Tax=Stichopus japonicus TaxID=307972 RepID=A0A2G8KD91_STIJA|nr:hypothetical protein BSL78_17169 [Apostichopus japonicus]
MIRVRQRCKECANITFWDSQTLIGNIPHGNLMMSAGILFAGSNPSKTLRVFNGHFTGIKGTGCIQQSAEFGGSRRRRSSNELSSSNAMELEGLKRGLQFFAGQNLQVNSLVTDRHRSISKYMREDQSEVDHRYDVCHIAKGTCKKIDKLGKKKTCAAAGAWAKSVSNHLYWVAASTPDGDGDVMLAKWLSVANHIQDVHQHASDLFPRCVH